MYVKLKVAIHCFRYPLEVPIAHHRDGVHPPAMKRQTTTPYLTCYSAANGLDYCRLSSEDLLRPNRGSNDEQFR